MANDNIGYFDISKIGGLIESLGDNYNSDSDSYTNNYDSNENSSDNDENYNISGGLEETDFNSLLMADNDDFVGGNETINNSNSDSKVSKLCKLIKSL